MFSANQKPFVICTRFTSLHSRYPQNSLRASSPIWASEVSLARTRERGSFVARSRVLARLAQIGELARRLPLEELHSFLSQSELSNFFEYIIKPISALVRLRAVSFSLVCRAKRARHANDPARDGRVEAREIMEWK